MKCPSCSTDLLLANRRGVEIDYCPHCRGVWLDRGELDKIVERSSRYGEVQDPEGTELNQDRPHDHHTPRRRRSFWDELFD